MNEQVKTWLYKLYVNEIESTKAEIKRELILEQWYGKGKDNKHTEYIKTLTQYVHTLADKINDLR